jgi:hypothetical protein
VIGSHSLSLSLLVVLFAPSPSPQQLAKGERTFKSIYNPAQEASCIGYIAACLLAGYPCPVTVTVTVIVVETETETRD